MNLIKRIKELEDDINEKLKSNNVVVNIINDKDLRKGKINILKDGKIDKVYEIKVINMDQIDIMENDNIVERELYRHNLGVFIYNLYNPVKYFYNFYGGKLNGKVLTRAQINEISNRLTEDWSKIRKIMPTTGRKELDSQPIVEGYYEPIYDGTDYGEIHLRYDVRGKPFILLL